MAGEAFEWPKPLAVGVQRSAHLATSCFGTPHRRKTPAMSKSYTG